MGHHEDGEKEATAGSVAGRKCVRSESEEGVKLGKEKRARVRKVGVWVVILGMNFK